MTYTVLARRYRPLAFDEVVGQDPVARTLKNAITEGRVGHAYLFSGPRGVGKTTMARLFAKSLNCVTGPTPRPCGSCEPCTLIHDGSDADVVEMDAASNRGVDDARALREGVRYAPLRSRFKIYLIDEAHMLTREAFNTLLKTLEEPPPHVKFFFATTESHKLPDTITSRCQRFDFRRITATDIATRLKTIILKEKLAATDDALSAIARAAKGSMRDAESLLDQMIAYKQDGLNATDVSTLLGVASDQTLLALTEHVQSGSPGPIFTELDRVWTRGTDVTAFTDQIIEHFRSLLLLKICGRNRELLDLPDEVLSALEAPTKALSVDALLYFIQLLLEARRKIKEGANPRLVVEVTLVKMSRASDLLSLPEAMRRLESVPVNNSAEPAPTVKPNETPTATQPPPATVSGFTPNDIGDVIRQWPRVVDDVKMASPLVSALLREGRPIRLHGSEIEFALPSQFTQFHLDQLDLPKHKLLVEQTLLHSFGQNYTIRYTLESRMPSPPAAPSTDPASPPAKQIARPDVETLSDPGIRKITETFAGTRIVGMED